VPKIRILLVGLTSMLNTIIGGVVAAESDMTIVGETDTADAAFEFMRHRRIDLVLFSRRAITFDSPQIDQALRTNPRLGLLAVDGPADCATLHHLVRSDDDFRPLHAATLAEAIRVGASLRVR
jgi:DNA-binding NarL/FixJ family response regulator